MKNLVRTLTAFALCFTLIFPVIIHVSASALDATEPGYTDLFQQVVDAGDDLTGIASALSEAFHNDPIGFFSALAQQDMPIWDDVCKAIADCNTGNGKDLEFLEFVLNVYASDGLDSHARNAFIMLLLYSHTDVSGADDEFITALFDAKRHSDGIGADELGSYIYELFLHDPVRMMHRFFAEDEAFQENMLMDLRYQSYNQDERYISTLTELSNNPELSEAQKLFVSKLMEELEPTPTENIEASQPTEETNITEPTVPGAPQQDESMPSGVPIGGIIAAAIVLAAVAAAIAVYLRNKKH